VMLLVMGKMYHGIPKNKPCSRASLHVSKQKEMHIS
jgi:hypothetical protein